MPEASLKCGSALSHVRMNGPGNRNLYTISNLILRVNRPRCFTPPFFLQLLKSTPLFLLVSFSWKLSYEMATKTGG